MRPDVHKSKRGNAQVMTSCLLSSNLHINLLQSRWRRNEEEEFRWSRVCSRETSAVIKCVCFLPYLPSLCDLSVQIFKLTLSCLLVKQAELNKVFCPHVNKVSVRAESSCCGRVCYYCIPKHTLSFSSV